jgi:hypothetical protein
MLELFLKVVFYVCAGLALTGVIFWYVTSLYGAVTGRSALVILPFAVADDGDGKGQARGQTLANLLHTRLQEIEHDLAASQNTLLEGSAVEAPPAGSEKSLQGKNEAITSIAPPLFATQGVSLHTRLLQSTEIKDRRWWCRGGRSASMGSEVVDYSAHA